MGGGEFAGIVESLVSVSRGRGTGCAVTGTGDGTGTGLGRVDIFIVSVGRVRTGRLGVETNVTSTTSFGTRGFDATKPSSRRTLSSRN